MTAAHREYPKVLPTNRTDFIHLPIGEDRVSRSELWYRICALREESRLLVMLLCSLTMLALLLAGIGAWVSFWFAVAAWLPVLACSLIWLRDYKRARRDYD